MMNGRRTRVFSVFIPRSSFSIHHWRSCGCSHSHENDGRKHRPYYRIVAIDHRQPRDGRVIEELGTYDPMIKNTDERVKLRPDRIKYWMSVGACRRRTWTCC